MGRLEVCGEYLGGAGLRGAAVFATAATISLTERRAPRRLRVRGRVEPAVERFGHYVDRSAFGVDLYAAGREAPLRAVGWSAQDQLEACWEWVRPAAVSIASACEVGIVDDLVEGRRALPIERDPGDLDDELSVPTEGTGCLDAFGRVLLARRRGRFVITPSLVRWDLAVLDVVDEVGGDTIHLAVPGPRLDETLTRIDDGALDSMLETEMARRARLSVLTPASRGDEVTAHRGVGRPSSLVPDERNPLTGRPSGPGGPGSRDQKHHEGSNTPTPRWVRPAAAVAAVLVVVSVILALTRGNDHDTLVADVSNRGGATTPTMPGGLGAPPIVSNPTGQNPEPPVDDAPCRASGSIAGREVTDAPTDVVGQTDMDDEDSDPPSALLRGFATRLEGEDVFDPGDNFDFSVADWVNGDDPSPVVGVIDLYLNVGGRAEGYFASTGRPEHDIAISGEPGVGGRVSGTVYQNDDETKTVPIDITVSCDPAKVPAEVKPSWAIGSFPIGADLDSANPGAATS